MNLHKAANPQSRAEPHVNPRWPRSSSLGRPTQSHAGAANQALPMTDEPRIKVSNNNNKKMRKIAGVPLSCWRGRRPACATMALRTTQP